MGVPDPGRERVQLRLVQMEPQLDGPGLDQVAVRVVVPLKDVADTVRGQRCAVFLPESFDDVAVGVEGLHLDRSACSVGVDLDLVADEQQGFGRQGTCIGGIDRDESVQSQRRQAHSAGRRVRIAHALCEARKDALCRWTVLAEERTPEEIYEDEWEEADVLISEFL